MVFPAMYSQQTGMTGGGRGTKRGGCGAGGRRGGGAGGRRAGGGEVKGKWRCPNIYCKALVKR